MRIWGQRDATKSSIIESSTLSDPAKSQVTLLLEAISTGEDGAADRLLPMVYDELRKLAQRQMAGEAPGHTLQATALVHEAYLRLVGGLQEVDWDNRRHFFGAAVKAMRRILVERARQRAGPQRGGGRRRVTLESWAATVEPDPLDLLALDEALTELEQEEPRINEIIMLRYFAGLSIDQTARALGLSPRTVDREWAFGKAWLFERILGGGPA